MREPPDPLRQTQALSVREAWADEPFWRDLPRNLTIAAAIGALLAYLGALGMDEAPLTRRLLYWVPLMLVGAVLGGAVASLVRRVLPDLAGPWLFGAIVSALVALFGGVLVALYTAWFWGDPLTPSYLLSFAPTMLILSAAMTATMILANRPGRVTHGPAPGAPPAPVRFLERLPAKLRGGEIHAVQAEDHYLRIHTSKGSDLILMRLADAIAELDGLEGAQVHRSWWVAKSGFEDAIRDGAKVSLKLKSGPAVPISRPNLKALRAAGWL